MHDVAARIALFPRVVVELGMGDGRLLESLAKRDDNTLHIGIELDAGQCDRARSRIVQDNVLILNGSFVDMLPAFPSTGF
jgi:tRNA G46 methylase TrmB